MPKQSDLKRLIRARMKETGEAYTAAGLHLVRKEPVPDYAALAGLSAPPRSTRPPGARGRSG